MLEVKVKSKRDLIKAVLGQVDISSLERVIETPNEKFLLNGGVFDYIAGKY